MAPRTKKKRRGNDDDTSLLDAIRNGPPRGGSGPSGRSGGSGGSSDSGRTPIGVPRGYSTPRQSYTYRSAGGYDNMLPRVSGYDVMLNRPQRNRSLGGGRPTIVQQGPRYFDGDEWKPGGMSPDGIAAMQQRLAAGGYLSGEFAWARWDDPTMKAYKQLLGEANAAGIDAESLLTERMNTPGAGSVVEGGAGGPGGRWTVDENGNPTFVEEQYVPPPLELRTTNKDDLRRVFRAAVIDTMGQGWSQEQINEVVDAYNWKEIQVQQDAYNQQVDIERAEFMGERTEGGEVISSAEIASPETFLENQLREKDPVGFETGQVVNEILPDFWQMMSGWS